MKKCPVCNSDFEKTDNRGSEKIYCSQKCSSIASRKRREARLLKSYENEQKKTEQKNEPIGYIPEFVEQSSRASENLYGNERQKNSVGYNRGFTPDFDKTDYLVKYYEAQIENNFNKLKIEKLEEKVKSLEKDIFELENELESFDEKNNVQGGFLGSVVEQFKTDPVNSIKFVNALLDGFKKK